MNTTGKGTEADFREYWRQGCKEIAERARRISGLRANPDLASQDDVTFLVERVLSLEQYLNDLFAAGAFRPRHEWNIWHQNIKEQLRLNREAFRGAKAEP